MTNSGNDRQLRFRYSAYDAFVVKDGQILDAASASNQGQRVQMQGFALGV